MNLKYFKNIFIKFLFLVLLLVLPFKIHKISDLPALPLIPENLQFYQENICSFSVFDLATESKDRFNFDIFTNINGPIECFGLNSWAEYQPEKLIENGWDKYEPDLMKIWIFTNPTIDLLLQSIYWLLLISLIPKYSKPGKSVNFYYFFPVLLIFYFHLYSEENFYRFFSPEYDYQLFSFEYNQELYIGNFYLYSYLINIFLILFIFNKLISGRLENFVNYLPFIFLIFGTYNSLNLNFYLIALTYLGTVAIFEKKINTKLTFLYLIFSLVWIINFSTSDLLFDTDKLKGFINSSQTIPSLIFWIIIYYFSISGLLMLINLGLNAFDLKLFIRNFLISGSIIYVLGILSSSFKVFNFFTYYFFGLNKFPIRNLKSIEGNTWRGIAPSAEAMGEFFAFTLLITFLFFLTKKINIKPIDIILIFVNIIGLIRTNNFAAISSSILLLVIIYIHVKSENSKLFIYIFFLLISTSAYIYLKNNNEYSFQYLSSSLIYEGIQATEMKYEFTKNEYGETPQTEGNYRFLLNLPEENTNMSSSLRFVLENYDSGYNIKYLPSVNSIINITSHFINRSEKWGIFLAKYDPTLIELLFGYGPQQLSEYYFGHDSKYNFGLFLPHSSFLNYLIFSGIFGLAIASYIISRFFKNSDNFETKVLLIFVVLNVIKSDSLLYLPNLILFVFVLNFDKLLKSNFKEKPLPDFY